MHQFVVHRFLESIICDLAYHSNVIFNFFCIVCRVEFVNADSRDHVSVCIIFETYKHILMKIG